MKYILLYTFYNILSIISANKNIPKFCIDCKFFKNNFFSGSEYAKCSFFPIEKHEYADYLVNGYRKNSKTEYTYCSIARSYDHLCGKEGKYYEKK